MCSWSGREEAGVEGVIAEAGELQRVEDLLHLLHPTPALKCLGVLVGIGAHLAVELAADMRWRVRGQCLLQQFSI